MSTCTKKDELFRCSKCGEMKPAKLFHRCKTHKRGRDYLCKECKNARNKQSYNKKKKRYSEVMEALREVCYEKVCRECRRLLPSHMFPKKPNSCDSLVPYCRDCCSRRHRKRQYGLTDEMLDEMLAVETCQMPGCGRKLGKGPHTHFDHCHKSGKLRAVLCSRCNHMLGHIEKNTHLVQPMLDYIAKHKADDESE